LFRGDSTKATDMSSSTPDERQIDQLEMQLTVASSAVFSKAYDQALKAGLSVMVSEDGAIYEIFPDGRRRLVKTIDPPTMTRAGQMIQFL
jgi:hypothetical protein